MYDVCLFYIFLETKEILIQVRLDWIERNWRRKIRLKENFAGKGRYLRVTCNELENT